MTSEILQSAWDIQDRVVAAKRQIHSVPELGMKEFETTALVRRELESMGIPMEPLGGPVGVLGVLRGKGAGDGKVIALRADMDALPIQETADVPDRSTVPGVMHACGHDCHTAMLLGAARLLASRTEQFSGVVKFLFQPAEETLGGARQSTSWRTRRWTGSSASTGTRGSMWGRSPFEADPPWPPRTSSPSP